MPRNADAQRPQAAHGLYSLSDESNSMKNWLFLFIAIIAEVTATSALKMSDGFTKLVPTVLVVLGYGTSFYFLSLTLRVIPVGIAYAVWSGLGVSLVALVSWFFLGQKLDAPALFGMALIVAGVVVLGLFSSSGTAH